MSRRLLFRLLASTPATDHVVDAELLRRFAHDKDAAAFELLVRRHADAVWAASVRILKVESDAEDAFQAAFLALIRRAEQIRTPCVGGWLHRVAVNAALKLRERNARATPTEPARLADVPAPAGDEPDADVTAIVHEELARLPERERLPVVLCDLEGLSHADAAAALGWPVGTVSGRLSRARARLRARLERRGLAPPAAVLPAAVGPARLIPNALSLTAGAPPAIISLAEGALAMNATTWKWATVAAVCAGLTGAGAAVGLTQPDGKAPTVPSGPPAQEVGRRPPLPGAPPNPRDKPETNWSPEPGAEGKIKFPSEFPELALPEETQFGPEAMERINAAFTKMCPRLDGKVAVKAEPTDDTYRKLLKARLHHGVRYVMRIRKVIELGRWHPADFPTAVECLKDMEAVCLELWGGQPKELIPWLEEFVVEWKEIERFTYLRVINGPDQPQTLDAVTRHRLRAEATLWKAKKRA
jgi:RNA polymerase sigma factor (sigma-70 family)